MTNIHDNAQKAAEATEAAGEQDAFFAYHDLLYERQADWSDLSASDAQAFFIELADELALDVESFTAVLESDKYSEYVLTLRDEAVALGMAGTPAIIFQGQVLNSREFPTDFETWQTFIDGELAIAEQLETQYDAAPEMTINPSAVYEATVTLENGETFVMELYPASAPETVNSFVFLAEEGWFDGVTFHRVLPGFVAQTGDPTGTGRGGPGYTIPNEIDPDLSHSEQGMVAMANSGPDTNGSQWYITLGDASFLDGSYTIFGRVVSNFDAVTGITPRDPQQDPNLPPGDAIESITIEEQ